MLDCRASLPATEPAPARHPLPPPRRRAIPGDAGARVALGRVDPRLSLRRSAGSRASDDLRTHAARGRGARAGVRRRVCVCAAGNSLAARGTTSLILPRIAPLGAFEPTTDFGVFDAPHLARLE